ncbi:MAG: flagellar biosynthetic protein FliQ [Clostridiales bacterium]|nr:MAG: flagellar biosynthetic protein FliQ [Clostridiales bacterium]
MSEQVIIEYFGRAIYIILITTAPMLISALVVGLIIAIFQATTQIQEQTLAFVPKIIVIFLVLIILGPWMINTLKAFTFTIFEAITNVAQ